MTDRSNGSGFGESPQARFDVGAFDLSDPNLLETLECVAHVPEASGGHPPTSIEGRRAQLAYMNALVEEGLRASEAGDVLSFEETEAFLGGLMDGDEPPAPAWVSEKYGA